MIYQKMITVLKLLFYGCKYPSRLSVKIPFYIGHRSYIKIGYKGKINIKGKINLKDHVRIISNGKLTFGNRCSINSFSRIVCHTEITLGERVVIAEFVSILDHDHNPQIINGKLDIDNFVSAPIKIGNYVWIGDKVTICKGVQLGDNIVVAANSVVTKSFPSNCIIGGIPAKIIKTI